MRTLPAIQRSVASTTDQLLLINLKTQNLLSNYSTEDQTLIRIQTNILYEQCKHLKQKLLEIQEELDTLDIQSISETQKTSLSVTCQLLSQNLLLTTQKQNLLHQLLQQQTDVKLKQALNQELEQEIQIKQIKQHLQQLFPPPDDH